MTHVRVLDGRLGRFAALVVLLLLSACAPAAAPTVAPATGAPVATAAQAQPTKAAGAITQATSVPVATTAPAQATKAPEPTKAAATMGIDKLMVSYAADPVNLDPPQAGGIVENVLAVQMFDSLVYRDRNGKISPRLAEKWENPTPTTWRFTLRKGVKFHNGEDLNAEVAKFSIERYKSKIAIQASRYTNVIGVKVIDPYTIEVQLQNQDPILPNSFVGNVFMLPPKYTQEKGDAYVASNPIGTGPYKFKEWVRGDHITLEAFADYWQGKPKIQTVVFRPIGEATTRVSALQNKEIDIVWEVPPALVKSVSDGGVADIKANPGPRAVYIGLRSDGPTPAPILADKRVRQALNYAVNRKGMVDKLLFGYATLVGQPIPSLYLGNNPSVAPYPYDPDKAKSLLKEAGVPAGTEIQLDYGSRWLTREQAQVVQSDLANVGINLKLNEIESTAFSTQLTAGKIGPMYSMSIQGRVGIDAIEIFEVAIITKGSFNWNNYSNPAADDLIQKGRSSSDVKEREKFFQQANQLVHDDPPWIYMWNNQSVWGVRKGINWSPRSDDMLFTFDDVK